MYKWVTIIVKSNWLIYYPCSTAPKLSMTGIMIRTKIAQMHDGVAGRLDENEPPHDFVDVDVVVQW